MKPGRHNCERLSPIVVSMRFPERKTTRTTSLAFIQTASIKRVARLLARFGYC